MRSSREMNPDLTESGSNDDLPPLQTQRKFNKKRAYFKIYIVHKNHKN